jgi:hypothetical protein
MKHTAEMASDGMIYVPRSTNTFLMILGEIIVIQGKGRAMHEL